jgi:hypothetical protein
VRQGRSGPDGSGVYCELRTWIDAGEIKSGKIFRRVSSAGKAWGDGVAEKLARHVMKESAAKTEFWLWKGCDDPYCESGRFCSPTPWGGRVLRPI